MSDFFIVRIMWLNRTNIRDLVQNSNFVNQDNACNEDKDN
jgi:hypothetical protein